MIISTQNQRKLKWFIGKTISCFFMVLLLLYGSVIKSKAASLSFIQLKGPNEVIQLALVLDQVDKLAGMKVAITYDKKALKFVKAEKTKATSSLMHVVNDKVPGKIIVVMAGAKGISGKNVQLMNLFFNRLDAKVTGKPSLIKVIELQLMSETLKDIQGSKPEFLIPFSLLKEMSNK